MCKILALLLLHVANIFDKTTSFLKHSRRVTNFSERLDVILIKTGTYMKQ